MGQLELLTARCRCSLALSCGLKTLVLRMLHVRLLPLETLNLVKLASYLATWKAQHSTVNEARSAVEYILKVSRKD